MDQNKRKSRRLNPTHDEASLSVNKSGEQTELDDDSEEENHRMCSACGESEKHGILMLCDLCPRSYHLPCAGFPRGTKSNELPRHASWKCPSCSGHSQGQFFVNPTENSHEFEEQLQPNDVQTRAQRDAAVAVNRAPKFARGEGFLDDLNQNATLHSSSSSSSDASSTQNQHNESQNNHNSDTHQWPGPVSTALHFQTQRNTNLSHNNATQLLSMINHTQSNRATHNAKKFSSSPLASLQNMCSDSIVYALSLLRERWIERNEQRNIKRKHQMTRTEEEFLSSKGIEVEDIDVDGDWEQPLQMLGMLHPELLEEIARKLAKMRRLDRILLPLFSAPGARVLALPDCAFLSESQLLSALYRVSSLETETTHQNVEGSLERIEFGYCGRCVSANVLEYLVKIGSKLEYISLQGAYGISGEVLMDFVSKVIKNLNTLKISYATELTSNDWIRFGIGLKLENQSSLQTLHIEHCQNAFTVPNSIRVLASFDTLKALSLSGMHYISSKNRDIDENEAEKEGSKDGLSYLLKHLKVLERLDVSEMKFEYELERQGVKELCKMISKHSRNLTHLKLDGLSELKDKDLRRISKKCTRIHSLSLRRCSGISDSGLISFLSTRDAASDQLVEWLNVGGVPKISDLSMIELSKVGSDSLRHLDVSFCRLISDSVLRYVVNSCQKSLRSVIVRACSQLNPDFAATMSSNQIRILAFGLHASVESNAFDSIPHLSMEHTEIF